jgi:hypothetical protein
VFCARNHALKEIYFGVTDLLMGAMESRFRLQLPGAAAHWAAAHRLTFKALTYDVMMSRSRRYIDAHQEAATPAGWTGLRDARLAA